MLFEAAPFEWADIAGAAPVFFAADDLAAVFFGAAFLARAFFGSSFDEKMPVMLSMMDIGRPSVELVQQCRPPEIVPLSSQLLLIGQIHSMLLNLNPSDLVHMCKPVGRGELTSSSLWNRSSSGVLRRATFGFKSQTARLLNAGDQTIATAPGGAARSSTLMPPEHRIQFSEAMPGTGD
ncbi:MULTISPECIES: hypothetical protein [unclassified Mesorhizobium]|uniref:hypothetical protein n=1 Tax=unclassified Mesorhizobium TaxID=325217 RepID=UPI001CC9492F|nr:MULTISPECIES: hypothetical protein [unclassified Mesorhizobium]MBZ9822161.1 hypothetical protein [Mesorhizobium sp. CA4]